MSDSSGKTILIIENDAQVRDTLTDMVQSMGHQTVAVERVTRGVQILSDKVIDAVLLDLHMPGPHGQDMLRFLRKRDIDVPPTIVVSGYLKEGAIGELLRLGVSGIIAKPFNPARLREELSRVLALGEAPTETRCPECSAGTRDTDRFCRHCGVSLEVSLVCTGCGAAYRPEDRFCGDCGANLSEQRADLPQEESE